MFASSISFYKNTFVFFGNLSLLHVRNLREYSYSFSLNKSTVWMKLKRGIFSFSSSTQHWRPLNKWTTRWRWQNNDGTTPPSSPMNVRETETHCHRTEGGNRSVNAKTYFLHLTLLCGVLHTPYCICTTKSYQPMVPSETRKTTTQMKDSTHTELDNLSDHQRPC